jgi:hypothetical protein
LSIVVEKFIISLQIFRMFFLQTKSGIKKINLYLFQLILGSDLFVGSNGGSQKVTASWRTLIRGRRRSVLTAKEAETHRSGRSVAAGRLFVVTVLFVYERLPEVSSQTLIEACEVTGTLRSPML